MVTSSDDGTVKLWDVKTGNIIYFFSVYKMHINTRTFIIQFLGEFIRNLIALESGGSGGVVWRIRANETKLVCAVGSRNGTEETKLFVLDFDADYK